MSNAIFFVRNHVIGAIPCEYRDNFASPETKMIVSYLTLKTARSFIWTKYQNVTDGRTDRQTDSLFYYSGRHCEQCGRAIKIGGFAQWLQLCVVVMRRTAHDSATGCLVPGSRGDSVPIAVGL